MAYHAIQMTDGSVAIMQTVGDAAVNDCIAKWPPAERAKVVSHKPVEATDIPQDRSFRNAWTMTGGKIVHDMPKARAILRDRLRAERAPLLAALDVESIRAGEVPVPLDEIIARKQALRDAPANPAIDLAMTVEELKSLTLDALTVAPIAAVSDAKLLA